MQGHIGLLFPRKPELWGQGRVPDRGEPSGATCSCREVWEYSQELGWGRVGGESRPVLQSSFPGLGLRGEERMERVTMKTKER